MKRIVLLLALVGALVAQNWSVKLFPLPPQNVFFENLWKCHITNNEKEPVEVTLTGWVTESDKEAARGTSNPITIPPGGKMVTSTDVTGGKWWFDSKYKPIAERRGTLPEGSYVFCIRVDRAEDGQKLAQECEDFSIGAKVSPPKLVTPRDGAEVMEARLTFVWTPPTPPPAGVTYTIRIAEVGEGMAAAEALDDPRPLFEEEGIRTTTFTYPPYADSLEAGMEYAWQVTAMVEREEIGKSSVWWFSIKGGTKGTKGSDKCYWMYDNTDPGPPFSNPSLASYPLPSFKDISPDGNGSGTMIVPYNDRPYRYALEDSFWYCGYWYSPGDRLYISPDGWVSFDNAAEDGNSYPPEPPPHFPNQVDPNALIASLWQDNDPTMTPGASANNRVYYQFAWIPQSHSGGELTVQWYNVKGQASGNTYDYELKIRTGGQNLLIVHPVHGVVFSYHFIHFLYNTSSAGWDADDGTTGLEDVTGDYGIEYTRPIHDGLVVRTNCICSSCNCAPSGWKRVTCVWDRKRGINIQCGMGMLMGDVSYGIPVTVNFDYDCILDLQDCSLTYDWTVTETETGNVVEQASGSNSESFTFPFELPTYDVKLWAYCNGNECDSCFFGLLGNLTITKTHTACDCNDPPGTAESPDPSSALISRINTNYAGTPGSRNCDQGGIDQYWVHTFTNLAASSGFKIKSATLEIRVRNGDGNDALLLGFIFGGNSPWDWNRRLTDLGVPVSNTWRWITLNLSSLPPSSTDLLSDIENNGFLDVAVQDDSRVDCARLTIIYVPE